MASLPKWCILGLLILSVGARAEDDKDDDDQTLKKKGCVTFTLKSTKKIEDTRQVKDSDGEPADIISVKVIKSSPEAKCVEDETFFAEDSYVTARRGCEAKFRVCYRTTKSPLPTPESGCKVVRLLSRLNREVEQTQEERVVSMRVVSQHQEGEICKFRENYGYNGRTIWANKGCRADFSVCFDDEDNTGDDEDDDDDEKFCSEIRLKSPSKGRKERKIRDSRLDKLEITSVRVTEQISDVQCLEGKNYEHNRTHVTVWGGCWAKFKICYQKIKSRPRSTPAPDCQTITLHSSINKDARQKIPLSEGSVRSMRVIKEDKRVRCLKNVNFGYRKNEVYATDGCKADFQVCLKKAGKPKKAPSSECVREKIESWGRDESSSKRLIHKNGDAAFVKSMTLITEFSDDECEEDKTFYFRSATIHVIDGCRGTFLVCFK